MSISEKMKEFVSKAEQYTDAEYKKALKEILVLFHNSTQDEQIDLSATASEAPVSQQQDEPQRTPESLTEENGSA